MWYSSTCVVSDASNNARVAQWWSVSLPRRRSRVRSPSRASFFAKIQVPVAICIVCHFVSRTYVFAKRGASTSQTSYEIRGSDLRLLKSPSVGSTGKRSSGPFSYAVSPRLALICMPRDFPLFKSGSLWVTGYKTLWSEAWCISRWYIVPQTIFLCKWMCR